MSRKTISLLAPKKVWPTNVADVGHCGGPNTERVMGPDVPNFLGFLLLFLINLFASDLLQTSLKISFIYRLLTANGL